MQHGSSLSSSEEFATGPYPQQHESSPQPHLQLLKSIYRHCSKTRQKRNVCLRKPDYIARNIERKWMLHYIIWPITECPWPMGAVALLIYSWRLQIWRAEGKEHLHSQTLQTERSHCRAFLKATLVLLNSSDPENMQALISFLSQC
jgi:hypothetical protein